MKITYAHNDATKAGNSRAEMEDAAAPAAAVHFEGSFFRCAVADGATQGSHSGPWARLLCELAAEAGCGSPADKALELALPDACRRFAEWEARYVKERGAAGRPLAWFEEEVVGSGAFATLLGIEVHEAVGAARFRACAVGDSCLFVVRHGQVATAFPLSESKQFGSAPFLLASQMKFNADVGVRIQWLDEPLHSGDRLLLCTDAIAAWILREAEHGRTPLAELPAGGVDAAQFQAFVDRMRSEKRMRNDDVTLVTLTVEL